MRRHGYLDFLCTAEQKPARRVKVSLHIVRPFARWKETAKEQHEDSHQRNYPPIGGTNVGCTVFTEETIKSPAQKEGRSPNEENSESNSKSVENPAFDLRNVDGDLPRRGPCKMDACGKEKPVKHYNDGDPPQLAKEFLAGSFAQCNNGLSIC